MEPEKGLTTMELMIIAAILAIVAGSGAFLFSNEIASQRSSSALSIGRLAVEQLYASALTNQGAVLTQSVVGDSTAVVISTMSGRASVQNYQLSNGAELTFNGQVISCIALDPRGIPTSSSPACSSVPNSLSTPFVWGIKTANGGSYVIP